MPSLKDMRGKTKEAGFMKLDKLIAARQRIPDCKLPIPVKELCERYEKLYTESINDVMRELTLLNQNLPGDIDGVLCIPRGIAYDALLRAEGIERNEVDIFSWVRQGDTISGIIDKGGYF